MSIQNQPDPRDERYLKLVLGRMYGKSDDAIIVQLADPDIDSPKALYRRLGNDGYPICPECGAAPVTGTHCASPVQKRRRRATQGKGEAQELPPPAAATHLLHEALRSLQRDVDSLSHRRDSLKNGRFVAEHVLSGKRGEAWQTHFRNDLSEEAWRELCEEYGADSSRDCFDVPVDSVQPAGVSQAPPEPLTRLIAVYVLSGYPVDLLLRKLHPNPEAVSAEAAYQLERHVEDGKVGLDKAARTVARLVRGGPVKPGRTTGGLSPEEEDAKAYIEERRQEGASDERILEELRAGYGFRRPVRFGAAGKARAWPDVSISDVRRLGNLS